MGLFNFLKPKLELLPEVENEIKNVASFAFSDRQTQFLQKSQPTLCDIWQPTVQDHSRSSPP